MTQGQAMTRGQYAKAVIRATMLAIGASIVWGGVALWTKGAFFEQTPVLSRYDNLVFYRGGDPLIESRSYTDYNDVQYRTVDGEPAEAPGLSPIFPGQLDGVAEPLHWYDETPGWSQRLLGISKPQGGAATWYAIQPSPGANSFYLEGFDSQTKRRIGYLGRNGVRPFLPPSEEWFEASSRKLFGQLANGTNVTPGSRPPISQVGVGRHLFIIDQGSVLRFDQRSQRLTKVDGVDGAISLATNNWVELEPTSFDVSATELDGSMPRSPSRTAILARTATAVSVIDPDRGVTGTFALPEEYAQSRGFAATLKNDDELILGGGWMFDFRRPEDLAWLTPTGEVTRRETLDALKRPVMTTGSYWTELAVAPIPFFAPLIVGGTSYSLIQSGQVDSFNDAIRRVVRDFAPGLITLSLLGVASAAWIAHRHRANYRGGVWLWPLLGLLLGPAGAMGYALQWKQPPRTKCAECGHDVPRNREVCPACQSEWPAPTRLGIEIVA